MMLSEIYCTDTLTLYHSAQHFVILVPSVCYLVCSTVFAVRWFTEKLLNLFTPNLTGEYET